MNEEAVVVYREASYLGSHPALTGQKRPDPCDLVVTTEGLLFVRGRRELGGIPWATVEAIHADNREGVESRVTATRVMLLGALAFVARKQTRLAYLVVEDDRGEWIFALPGLTAIELEASVKHLQRFVPRRQLPPPSVPAMGAPADGSSPQSRLMRLSELRAKGLLTDDEYADQRAAIVRSL